jgi:hypothetical protein
MKYILFLLLLWAVAANAQTKVISGTTFYTKTGTDAAIKAIPKQTITIPQSVSDSIVKVIYNQVSTLFLSRADSVNLNGWTSLYQNSLKLNTTDTTHFVNIYSNQSVAGNKTFSGSNTYGTPASINLSNATALPVSSGISGLGTGVATWLATPSSANLLAALTTKTGTGDAMFSISPTLTGIATTDTILTKRLNLTGSNYTAKINLASTGSYTVANGMVWGNNDVALYQSTQFGLATNGSFSSLGGIVTNSTLSVTGLTTLAGLKTGYVAKTANYTVGANDYAIECTANSFNVTLPTAVGRTGAVFEIVNSGAGTISILTTSSQTFVNVAATPTSLTMATVGTRVVKSNGANWMLISSL